MILKLIINITIHHITVEIIAQTNQMVLISIMFNVKFIIIAIVIILTLSLTFQSHAIILKLIEKRTLNTINNDEYCNNSQDLINLVQNNTLAISGHNTKNKVQIINEKTEKYL